jgi:hypothetical protein
MSCRALRTLGLALVAACLSCGVAHAQTREYFRTEPSTRKYVVIFGGLGADNTYAERFREWTFKLHDIPTGEYGYRPEHITLLLGDDTTGASIISGPCRRETILETLTALKQRVQLGDQVSFISGPSAFGTSKPR